MSEKVKAKKTRPSGKKVPGKRAKEDVEPPSLSPKLLKSKKKSSKVGASVNKPSSIKKKTAKAAIVALQERETSENIKNPPLEEIFAKADHKATALDRQSADRQQAANVALHSNSLRPVVEDEVNFMQNLPSFGQEHDDAQSLKVKLSRSLLKKIQQQAEDEGLSIEDFVIELLAESVVLRAWEIVERKNQMRNPASSTPNHRAGGHSPNSNNNQNRGQRNSKQRGGMSHGRYQSIMDDKATFLEYVRNQEKSRR